METEFDVAIVGGGMVGASLACALADTPVRVVVLEATAHDRAQQPSYDDRGLALSMASRRILAGIEIWRQLQSGAAPIRHVHVSERGKFGCVRLHAADVGAPECGHVVLARNIGHALLARIADADNIQLLSPAKVTNADADDTTATVTVQHAGAETRVRARLVVIADGSNSVLRETMGFHCRRRDYQQVAIVAAVMTELDQPDTAYERFTTSGPIALLPIGGRRRSVVFTVAAEQSEYFMALDETDFLSRLQKRFGRRLGEFCKLGKRRSYPLQLLIAEQQSKKRVLLLGNVAHTIHPNAAQGFNLGLRDAAALAELLIAGIKCGEDPGSTELLRAYVSQRRADQARVIAYSDRLARIFASNAPHHVVSRSLAMLVVDLVPVVKRTLMLRGMGLSGRQPGLVRGVS